MLRNLPRVLHSGCSQFPFPASVWEDSLCSTLTPAFIVCRISAYGHSDQCERWYLMEVLICLSLIFSDVDISSRVFFFKQWELNLFKLASWINIQNIFPVLNIFPMTSPRTFLEGRYFSLTALQALGILSAHEQWFQSCCYGKWPQGGSMSFCPTVVTEGTRALGKVWFLDCQNGRCQKKNLRLVYHSSSFLTVSPGHIPVPATPLWGGCFHR